MTTTNELEPFPLEETAADQPFTPTAYSDDDKKFLSQAAISLLPMCIGMTATRDQSVLTLGPQTHGKLNMDAASALAWEMAKVMLKSRPF